MEGAGEKYHALREDYPGHTNGESLANGEENLELVNRAEEGLSSMSTEKHSIVPGVKRDGGFPSEKHTSVGRSRHVCRRWMKYLGWMCELAMDLLRSFHHVILGSKLNVLLLCVPLAIVGVPLQFGQGWVFLLSLLGMAPLAERLGFVTEQLSFVTGSTVGGLLNATFGNATEMIICIFALKNNMIRVVQLSLLGSILSNMLLVLGSAFLFGGLAHPKKTQTFRKATAQVSSGLLLMAVMGLLFPATLHATKTEMYSGESELILSRFSSIVMLVAYTAYLYFQLRSHRELYDPEGEGVEGEAASDSDECKLAFWVSIAWLTILTIFISILSEYLIDAIEGASTSWNVPVSFISVIILPIVGNAAEHASAIMFALKDKLIPFCVVIGWPMGTDIDLNFQLFETTTLFITVLVVAFMLQDGTANYFKGLMLVLCYSIVGASFFVHLDHSE
ncbi:hypothetical protein CY35_01G098000 [Sphagnum magellanicum]|nr:hypothetical protein CY35_01G098000 [Sphagnum magellanicum]KAH9575176.1 hypothetical protein CY35_01G098000 [Sphagnum magellanicum]